MNFSPLGCMFNITTTSIFQVALDCGHLIEARQLIEIVEQELSGLAHICEAGIPLIKNEGLKNVIPALRSLVGKKNKKCC